VPNVIIVAGPNGAGKTTFADEYLSEERRFELLTDEIRSATIPSRSAASSAPAP
jgi:predicted ABC-type ATPase